MAVGGIQNGLAIEFDTYNNGAGDIASDHTGFRGTSSAFATTPVALANIENGAWHPVVVTWNATTQTLSYTFDGQPMGTPLTSNIATQFLGGSNFAYFGFGAGTGGLSQHAKRSQHQRHRHLRRQGKKKKKSHRWVIFEDVISNGSYRGGPAMPRSRTA